jgi:integrase
MVYRHGLRASEGVGMRWSQVDLDQGVIHIARVKGSKAGRRDWTLRRTLTCCAMRQDTP